MEIEIDRRIPVSDAGERAGIMLQAQACTEELVQTLLKLLSLETQLVTLHTKLNTTVPISRLPDEILGAIFVVYVHDQSWEYVHDHWVYYVPSHLQPYSWFRILHVCHAWRQIAFSNPALWTCTIVSDNPVFEFVLSKSGNLPLTILGPYRDRWYYYDQTLSSLTYARIFERLPRIRRAEFWINEAFNTQLTALCDSKPEIGFDALEELNVNMSTSLASPDRPPFASIAMPCLKSLRIGGTIEMAQSLVRPSLTTLAIHLNLHQFYLDSELALDRITTILSHLPILQSLSLSTFNNIPRPDALPPALHKVSLPHLKQLKLRGTALDVAAFIRRLIFPSTTKIQLFFRFRRESSDVANQADLLLALPHITGRSSRDRSTYAVPRIRPRMMKLDNTSMAPNKPPGLTIQFWRDVLAWPREEINDLGEPEVQFVFPDTTLKAKALYLSTVLSFFDISEIVTMNIRIHLPADSWVRIFTDFALPKLESIRVFGGNPVKTLLRSITRELPQRHSTADGETAFSRYLFPDLRTVELESVALHRKPHAPQDRRDFSHTIYSLLKSRAMHVHKLQHFVLLRPINVLPSDYEKMNMNLFAERFEVYEPTVGKPKRIVKVLSSGSVYVRRGWGWTIEQDPYEFLDSSFDVFTGDFD